MLKAKHAPGSVYKSCKEIMLATKIKPNSTRRWLDLPVTHVACQFKKPLSFAPVLRLSGVDRMCAGVCEIMGSDRTLKERGGFSKQQDAADTNQNH